MKPENNIRHIACTDTVNLTAYTYDRLIFANPWWNFAKVNGKSLSIFGSKCLDIRVRDLEVCTDFTYVGTTDCLSANSQFSAYYVILQIPGEDETDGVIQIIVTGGSGNYQYSLDCISWQTSNKFYNIYTGNYSVTIMDMETECQIAIPVSIGNQLDHGRDPDDVLCDDCAPRPEDRLLKPFLGRPEASSCVTPDDNIMPQNDAAPPLSELQRMAQRKKTIRNKKKDKNKDKDLTSLKLRKQQLGNLKNRSIR